jgi:hypothetical protein
VLQGLFADGTQLGHDSCPLAGIGYLVAVALQHCDQSRHVIQCLQNAVKVLPQLFHAGQQFFGRSLDELVKQGIPGTPPLGREAATGAV